MMEDVQSAFDPILRRRLTYPATVLTGSYNAFSDLQAQHTDGCCPAYAKLALGSD
jgi:hypothetical protein